MTDQSDAATPAMTQPGDTPETAGDRAKPRHHGLWEEVKSIAVLVLAVIAFHSLVAKPFYIPSESMMPVLLKGDRLVVSKYAYGWSYVSPSFHILPPMPGRLFGRLPERGDIVIVQPRGRREDYIKRVVGLPGDTLEVSGGRLIINGTPAPQVVLPPLALPVDANAPCDPFQFAGALAPSPEGGNVCLLPVRQETLPNGRTYKIIDMGTRTVDYYGPIRIPAGHVFLMGDNRDNSADSRVPLEEDGLGGPVPVESIGGRAEFITFSLNGTSTLNPMTWPGAFRPGRAFSSLRPEVEQPQE